MQMDWSRPGTCEIIRCYISVSISKTLLFISMMRFVHLIQMGQGKRTRRESKLSVSHHQQQQQHPRYCPKRMQSSGSGSGGSLSSSLPSCARLSRCYIWTASWGHFPVLWRDGNIGKATKAPRPTPTLSPCPESPSSYRLFIWSINRQSLAGAVIKRWKEGAKGISTACILRSKGSHYFIWSLRLPSDGTCNLISEFFKT